MVKEKYLDEKGLSRQSEDLLASVGTCVKKTFTGLDIRRTALLVLDMQDYFLNEGSPAFLPSAPAIVPSIVELQRMFTGNNLPVIQTRHTNTLKNAGMMKNWWQRLMSPDDPLTGIIPALRAPGITVIEKHQYDAFYQTGLQNLLHDLEIRQVVITGVTTHLCCETTARSAFVRGFEVFLVVDATATYTREFHRASLLTLSHGFAVPVRVREIAGCFA